MDKTRKKPKDYLSLISSSISESISSSDSSALLVVASSILLPCVLWWEWRTLRSLAMNAWTKVGRVIKCDWIRYQVNDDEEEYNDLVHRGTVANAIQQYEQNQKVDKKEDQLNTSANSGASPTCRQAALSGASSFLGLFFRGKTNAANDNNKQPKIPPIKTHPCCAVCQERIFPTDPTTTARQRIYHTRCFHCSFCKSKLKNAPDELHHGHNLVCGRCQSANIRRDCVGRVAGEKIVVTDLEQGDIRQVKDLIGDELEDAIYHLRPKCGICGGDFLQYAGEISMVGSLKYHQECFQTGKPSPTALAESSLDPVQAAKHLPRHFILRLLSNTTGKQPVTTLFFVWANRDADLKALRRLERNRDQVVSVEYQLDPEARANPNHPRTKKTTVPSYEKWTAELVGGNAPSVVALKHSNLLEAKLEYTQYNLLHSLHWQVPISGNAVELLGAKLAVQIRGSDKFSI